MAKLKNLKHEAFCLEYSATLNAAGSYDKIYGYPKGSKESAAKLLTSPNVAGRVRELITKRLEKVEVSGDKFLEQLRYAAMFDPKEVFDFDGERMIFKSFDEIPIEARRLIDSVKAKNYRPKNEDPYTEIEVRFTPKAKMKELWARHAGHLNDRLHVKQEITLESLVGESFDTPTD